MADAERFFLPPEHRESLKGSLARHTKVSVRPGRDWDKAREAAWAEAAEQRFGAERSES